MIPNITTTPPGLTLDQMQTLHDRHRERLPMWTVYAHPRDYPHGYVARMFLTLPAPPADDAERAARAGQTVPPPSATNVAMFSPSLDSIQLCLPLGLVCLKRDPADDPCIVETWL